MLKELPNVEPVYLFYKWNLINNDPDDNKYTDCTIAGSADYLVTQDGHFDILKSIAFPKITIVTIDEFVSLIDKL